MEQPIIQPISKEVLKSELTPDKQLRMTNKSNNEIYVVTAHNAPNVMQEIGRLREIAFREAGGGTGKPVDIDEFDTCDNCYKQLIVWNPEAEEIIKRRKEEITRLKQEGRSCRNGFRMKCIQQELERLEHELEILVDLL